MPAYPIINIGDRFGKLVVLSCQGLDKAGNRTWKCLCDCDNQIIEAATVLNRSRRRSCGCLKGANGTTTHNLSRTPEYAVWNMMIARCYRPKAESYYLYGGRGIAVCDEWRNSFETFYCDMGARPSSEHSIERRDNDGHYCKENCFWATRQEQGRNKRSNVMLTLRGQTRCIAEWPQLLGIAQDVLYQRHNRLKWSDERALLTPVRPCSKRPS